MGDIILSPDLFGDLCRLEVRPSPGQSNGATGQTSNPLTGLGVQPNSSTNTSNNSKDQQRSDMCGDFASSGAMTGNLLETLSYNSCIDLPIQAELGPDPVRVAKLTQECLATDQAAGATPGAKVSAS